MTAPDGGEYSYETDTAGNITKVTDALGAVYAYEYDGLGRLLAQTDPLGRKMSYEYDSAGRCIKKTNAEGTVTKFTYDPLGNLTSAVLDNDGELLTVSWSYDSEGRPLTYTDERGYTISCNYREDGEIEIKDAAGTVLVSSAGLVDGAGSVVGGGNTVDSISNNTTTATAREDIIYQAGKTTTVTDELGGVSSLSLNSDGTVECYTDPLGNTTTYTYDTLGNLVSEKDATGAVKKYAYNAYGEVTESVNARGQKTTYEYDLLGRITKITDELGNISYGYDKAGNLLTVTDEKGTIRRTYDSMNRVISYTDINGNTIKYDYDRLGNITGLTYPDGSKVTYAYEKGLLVKVSDSEGRVTEYERDILGRVVKTINANGTSEEYTYDKDGRLTNQKTLSGSTIIRDAVYRYNEDGSMASVVVTGGENGEGTGVLTTTTSTGSGNVTATKTTTTTTAPPTKTAATTATITITATFTYGADNRLATYNGQAVRYDADGNMTYGPVNGAMTELTYDCRNRLVSAGGVSYEYDAESVRTAVITDNYREEYVTDSVQSLTRVLMSVRTYTDGSTETFRYVYGNGLVSEEWSAQISGKSALPQRLREGNTGSHSRYLTYHYNHLGSTVMLTEYDGSIAETYKYGVYGELLDGDASLTAFLYNGQYGVMMDDNGLNYMRARYYDSSIKRFINRDILTGSIEDSRSLNRYAYCYGNPVSYTDPFGLSPLVSMRNHAVLDVIGMIPGPIGAVADLANAVYYLSEGNTGAAAVCVVFAIVPGTMAGSAVQLFGASKTAGQLVNAVVGMSICGYGVYNNASQVSADISRIYANWDYYTDEQKSLEMQIIACDIMGIAGSAAGSMSSAHNLAKMDIYQKWEDGAIETIKNTVDGAADWVSGKVQGLLVVAGKAGDIFIKPVLNDGGFLNLDGFKSGKNTTTVKPEAAVTGSKKHGVNWKEGPARAKATGNPQGQWAKSDLDYATEMANTLKPGESAYFDLPEGSQSIVHMPDGTTQLATRMWIRNNGTGTWHGYPMPALEVIE